MKEFISCKLSVLGFLLFLGLPAVASAQKLIVGYSGITAIQAPFWVIKDAGYFKQEGLDADLIISRPHQLWRRRCWPGR